MPGVIELTDRGLYSAAGDFYIDPWQPVPRAVLTHAHSDHATPGHGVSIVARDGERIFRTRLGDESRIETLAYGETRAIDGVYISLHPAGHILGSSQVRVEHKGEVWVVSGDYKTVPDPTCAPFEAVECHTFITEATFGLPIYRWPAESDVFDSINAWWAANAAAGVTSIVLAYALGKAQRVLARLDTSIGRILTHGAVEKLVTAYRESGIALPPTEYAGAALSKKETAGALVIAPPSADGTPWARRFGKTSSAFCSGWMAIRGTRRRRSVDRGFTLSDHADWQELQDAIAATGAERVLVTHGYIDVLVRWLNEQGIAAEPLRTLYQGEAAEESAAATE